MKLYELPGGTMAMREANQWLGLNSEGLIAPEGTEHIEVIPMVLFRPLKLIIPNMIADSFVIQDMVIGPMHQFVGMHGIWAHFFREDSEWIQPKYRVVQSSEYLSIRVANVGTYPTRFISVFLGTISTDTESQSMMDS